MGEREAEKNHFGFVGLGISYHYLGSVSGVIIILLRFVHLCMWSGAGLWDILFFPFALFYG